MTAKTAYKLFKLRQDGTLGSLFINAKEVIPLDKWLVAEDHPTKGFAHRPGWHCTLEPIAPHIKINPKGKARRVWAKVRIKNTRTYDRPESQGGTWVLAEHMKVLEVLSG